MVQAFLKKWWVESDFKAPNLPLALRFKGSDCHYNSIYYKIKDKRLQGKVTKTIHEKNEFEKRLIETENELKTVNEMLNEKEANLNQLEVHVEVSKEKIKELKQEKHKLQKRLCRLKSRRSKCNLVERHEIEIKELKK